MAVIPHELFFWSTSEQHYVTLTSLTARVVTCDVIESSCCHSVNSSSNHIWKECAGPGLGYWRCGISYGWNLTTCSSQYRNLAPPFASAQDAAGTLPGPGRAANRMEVTWLNCATGYTVTTLLTAYLLWPPDLIFDTMCGTVAQGGMASFGVTICFSFGDILWFRGGFFAPSPPPPQQTRVIVASLYSVAIAGD